MLLKKNKGHNTGDRQPVRSSTSLKNKLVTTYIKKQEQLHYETKGSCQIMIQSILKLSNICIILQFS